MKASRGSIAAAATVATLLSPVQAFPHLKSRQNIADYASLIKPILEWFGVAFPEVNNAWDYGTNPDMCSIKMETKDGGNCKASVTCNDGVTTDYKPDGEGWNACFVGGRQYFTDPRIGDFSITFSQKDGEGEGLTNPIVQLAYVDNWREFPAAELAYASHKANECEKGLTPLNCDQGPFICQYGNMGNSYIWDSKQKRWECGMPRTGKGGPEGTGIDSNGPINDRNYAPGWCVAHITQHQKPNPATDAYGLEATIKDANQNKIGGTDGKGGPTLSLTSQLPYTLEIKTGGIDADPMSFGYGDQSWDSNDASRCKVGAYDSGSRQMDCGFNC